jgi:adenylosuccinate lyase
MRENLTRDGGLVMAESLLTALRGSTGTDDPKGVVEALVATAQRQGRSLAEVARADARVVEALGAGVLERVFDPSHALGANDQMIDAALRAWRALDTEVGA